MNHSLLPEAHQQPIRLAFLRLLLVLPLIGFACPITLWNRPPQPEIITFRVVETIQMSYMISYVFAWETLHAESVSLRSGYIEEGRFYPGGWYVADHLPLAGSTSFSPKIDNYAAQLCVEGAPLSRQVCAVCDPFHPETCP